ncbi:MAG: SLC13 family permease [Candidatus Odinarchaeota archaeon]
MLLSAAIVTCCFLAVVILILLEKMHRTILALSGAIITYFTLTFMEGFDFSDIVELLFGSQADGFVNLHSLILIISMMFIVQIADEAGLFQFLAVIAIKWSKGKPIQLMTIFCIVSVLFSSLLNNILTVMILIPLTVTVSRILNVNPEPYIITQAILVNLGGTVFSISSIPNILITTASGITFTDYFLTVGLFSIIAAFFSITYFTFLYKADLVIPKNDLIKTLAQFDIWNVVQSPRLMITSLIAFVVLIVSFVLIPPEIVPTDIIALTIAMVLTIISGIKRFGGFNAQEIMEKFDYQLLLYLLGIFIIAGGLEVVGVINQVGTIIQDISGGNPFILVILLMWIAALLSSLIDNIPITKVLIPIIGGVTANYPALGSFPYYSLCLGANWGDNLTPMGDNILVMNIAAQHKRPITMKTFWKLGFTTTLLQLVMATIYFVLLIQFIMGLIVIGIVAILALLLLVVKFSPTRMQHKVDSGIIKLRRIIIA